MATELARSLLGPRALYFEVRSTKWVVLCLLTTCKSEKKIALKLKKYEIYKHLLKNVDVKSEKRR